MKLIFCKACHDVVALRGDIRHCECGMSWGKYEGDGLNAVIAGEAVPIGFANNSFITAVLDQPKRGQGRRFEAFVIPKKVPTVVKKR